MLGPSELEAMAVNIANGGQNFPIILFEGRILDGRNRYAACLKAGVTPRCEVYEGEDPLGFVVSANLQRRHLGESQRGLIAARIAQMGVGRPSKDNPPNGGISAQPKPPTCFVSASAP
jgi:hypothetical protein